MEASGAYKIGILGPGAIGTALARAGDLIDKALLSIVNPLLPDLSGARHRHDDLWRRPGQTPHVAEVGPSGTARSATPSYTETLETLR